MHFAVEPAHPAIRPVRPGTGHLPPPVLVTLARTAHQLGKLPPAHGPATARTYLQLREALEQLGRLPDALTP